jgi:hypothetical protein
MPMSLLVQTVSQVMSLICGSVGVFFLWASFEVPRAAVSAIFYLSIATAITYARSKAS